MKTPKDLTPDATAILVKTSELLKAGTTIGSYARDKHGFPVSPVNDGAACYCTLGGMFKVASEMLLIEALPNTGLLGTELQKCAAAVEVIDLLAEQGTTALADAGGVLEPQVYDPEPGTEKLSTVIRLNDRTDELFLSTIHRLAEEARPKVIDFLRMWLAWAEAGGQEPMFDDRYGLCWNFANAEWEPHNLRIATTARRFYLRGQPANQGLFTLQLGTGALQQLGQMQIVGQPPLPAQITQPARGQIEAV